MTDTKRTVPPGAPLIALGVVFIAIGASGQRAFIAIGAAFAVIGFAMLAKARRGR